jgi:hypothetical protein
MKSSMRLHIKRKLTLNALTFTNSLSSSIKTYFKTLKWTLLWNITSIFLATSLTAYAPSFFTFAIYIKDACFLLIKLIRQYINKVREKKAKDTRISLPIPSLYHLSSINTSPPCLLFNDVIK